MRIECYRTPDERFLGLPGFPWAPRYVDDLPGYEGMRLAYLDEGPRAAKHTFLCLHGEPTWSFLYRKMIPVFLEAGGRVVAPDLFGFGRSDKPLQQSDYTFHFHRASLLRLIERLDLRHVTLVVQDWGGLLGLTLPIADGMGGRFARLIVMNTGLIAGEDPGEGFLTWQRYAKSHPDLAVGKLIKRGTPHLTDAEVAAYDAPFPEPRAKAGVSIFPSLVMTDPTMEGVAEVKLARTFWREAWAGQSFMAFGAWDPIFTAEAMEGLRRIIRGCPPAMVIEEGGHFVQEWGEPIARAALASFG